jgi:hypothetical protein
MPLRNVRIMMREGPFLMRRLGRILFWRDPVLYRWLGVIRDRGDCLEDGFEVWMGGYPRSANTFAVAAFKLANPAARLASHLHIPPFIIHSLHCKKPGIFLIRRPEEAVVSWTIYWEGRMKLADSLDYYIDFHRSMLSHVAALFVSPFEETTSNFGQVVRDFNAKFGTHYASLPLDETTMDRCFSYIEDRVRSENGSVNEFTVSRPTATRDSIKPKLFAALRDSSRLSRKLKIADELYHSFCLTRG